VSGPGRQTGALTEKGTWVLSPFLVEHVFIYMLSHLLSFGMSRSHLPQKSGAEQRGFCGCFRWYIHVGTVNHPS